MALNGTYRLLAIPDEERFSRSGWFFETRNLT
jgi:hypothetical protein